MSSRAAPPPVTSSPAVPSPPTHSSLSLPTEPLDIGIWGPTDVGKTVFLGAAIKALRSLGYNVTEPLQFPKGDERREVASQFLIDIQAMLADGPLPGSTLPDAPLDLRPFSLNISYEDHEGRGISGRFHRLDVSDASGSYCQEKADHIYYQLLCRTKGILLIIDGTQRQADSNATFFGQYGYSSLVENLVTQLGKEHRGHRFPHYLAICITKADGMPSYQNDPLDAEGFYQSGKGADRQRRQEDVLEQIIDSKALNVLRYRFDWEHRVRIFLTSSVGWVKTPQKNTWESNLDAKGNRLKYVTEWQTYHVADAVLWLLDRIEHDNLYGNRRLPLFTRLFFRGYIERNRIKNGDIMKQYVAKKQLDWTP